MFNHSGQREKKQIEAFCFWEQPLTMYKFMVVEGYGFNSNLDQTLNILTQIKKNCQNIFFPFKTFHWL